MLQKIQVIATDVGTIAPATTAEAALSPGCSVTYNY